MCIYVMSISIRHYCEYEGAYRGGPCPRNGGAGGEAVVAGWHRVGQEESGNLARSHRDFKRSTEWACCLCRMKGELFLRNYRGRRQTYVVLQRTRRILRVYPAPT